MPEGDTIAYAAARMRPVLEGQVPDDIRTPHPRHALDRWPERLRGRAVSEIRTHGKNLFLRFEGDLVIHSHLRMTGTWGVYPPGRRWGRSPRLAWLVLERGGHQVVQFNGPVLELMTEGRARFDQRLAGLGPDVLAPRFDAARFLARLRADDYTRGIGDALLDQRNVAGIGNIWKAEGCWDRPVAARLRGQRRGGGGHRRGAAAAHAGLRPDRADGWCGAGVSPQRASLPPMRRDDPGPRPGGRQPHDVLVPGLSALRWRRGQPGRRGDGVRT